MMEKRGRRFGGAGEGYSSLWRESARNNNSTITLTIVEIK